MKRIFAFLFAIASLWIPHLCFAGISDYPTVAVVPVVNQVTTRSIPETELDIARDTLNTDLLQSGYFNMVERARVDALISEFEFDMSGLVDTSTAAKFGKMLGAQYVVIGSVTGLSIDPKNRGKMVANISARMVEVETARIALAGRGKGVGSSTSEALEAASDDAIEGNRGMLMMLRGGK